jgi:hypothetical protein
MLVVGGTYNEICENPRSNTVGGSGLRAAAALTEVEPSIRLISAAENSERQTLEFSAGALEVDVDFRVRSRPVGFSYFTPLTAPTIGGVGSALDDPILVNEPGECVLVFGLVESGKVQVRGRHVVLDPQKPRGLYADDLPDVSGDQVAWVLNERETRQLAGNVTDMAKAARDLLQAKKLDVIVTKLGARGALVTTADAQEAIGAFRTNRVYPIGSGDVFGAAFAWAWGDKEMEPVAAARAASAAAAYWCDTQNYPVPAHVLEDAATRRALPPVDRAKVYLAAPFFNLGERWLVDIARWALAPDVFSPLHEVGPGDEEVAKKDLDGLEGCSAVLALLDGEDPGTIFEAGYATKLGIPVVGYAERFSSEGRKMFAGTGATLLNDLPTAVYTATWAAIEHRAAQIHREA